MSTFAEMWDAATQYGADLRGCAEAFYIEAVKAGWPLELVQKFLNIIAEIDGLRNWYDENLGEKGDLNSVLEKLRKHKHAVTGETMLPLE
jgi:hypothetical protein